MTDSPDLEGRFLEPRYPVREPPEPLELFAGRGAVAWFDYQLPLQLSDGTILEVYRHWVSAGHLLYLEHDGRPWAWLYPEADRYRPTSGLAALERGWPTWCADPVELAARAAAFERIQRAATRSAA